MTARSKPWPRLRLDALQPLGRALMLPIAVLPAASLMLRLGQPDLAFIPGLATAGPLIGAAGDAIFSNLGLLFAIGMAVGLAAGGDGAAGLAGAVCFLVATHGAQALIHAPADALVGLTGKSQDLAAQAFKAAALAKLGVPIGIVSGMIGGGAFNRFGAIRLPDYLAFFGGRRFAPIVAGFAGLVVALVVGFGWPAANQGMDSFSRAIVTAGPLGLFAYGALNRLLIVTGLHHILNNIAWFIVGDFHGATGDLNRFFAGDPTAGAFMSGFFPVMMFGLPAACLAMYHAARPERRKAVGGMLLSLALTALLTGVTEPIEFSFMFLAPPLYALHAILTGVAMVVMNLLGVHLGFGFSAGLLDFVLNFNKAQKPWLLFPVGAAYALVYYAVFRVVIARFNLKTPGREDAPAPAAPVGRADRAAAFIAALGGAANLRTVDACTTRLRLRVADSAQADAAQLAALGSRGIVRVSPQDLQVVLGPHADDVAREIRAALALGPALPAATPLVEAAPAASPADVTATAGRWIKALGGIRNIRVASAASSRLRVVLNDPQSIDLAEMRALGLRALARPAADTLHLVLGPTAAGLAAAIAAAGD
jgi:PTS system N-acetylglucosamine-specific IIC component